MGPIKAEYKHIEEILEEKKRMGSYQAKKLKLTHNNKEKWLKYNPIDLGKGNRGGAVVDVSACSP